MRRATRGWWGLALLSVACGPAGGPTPPNEVPSSYSFLSRAGDGQSSVAYTGQTFRHVLIGEMKSYLGKLTARIDNGFVPATGDVAAELDFYYAFDAATSGDVEMALTSGFAAKQKLFKELSASGAKLSDKIAGKDPVGQHKEWANGLRGWNGASSPEALVRTWFTQLDQLAVDRANGIVPLDPSGAPIGAVHVTAEGHDLRELLQKFLDGAVGYSQGADDYLDDDLPEKGLNSDHRQLLAGKPYTELEHTWDEGFGYFGAARDFADYTAEEASAAGGRTEYAKGHHDTDGDGLIDLTSEYNFGHVVAAAKRDRTSAASAKTDFAREAFKAFLAGRYLLATTHGELTVAQKAELRGYRDGALSNWEKGVAASTVHYINQVLQDMERFGTTEYKFTDHAKHWSELKAFALSLQFNRLSKLKEAQLDELHAKVGQAPVLANRSTADIESYKTALRQAKGLLGQVYGFDPANVGDDLGVNGW
ncbi:MAG: DUF4856 domain-containing protein [Myxococcota bacterium]